MIYNDIIKLNTQVVGIYKIINPNGKIYIGQSINIEKRWKTYMFGFSKGQIKLHNSFVKYGVKNHLFEIVEICDEVRLNLRERYWQDYYECIGANGLNLKLTQTNDKSGKYSEELKIKLSKSALGRKMSEDSKIKMRNFNLGKKLSEETKRKISEKNKGFKHSKETKDKLSKDRLGEKNTMYKKIVSKETRLKISNSNKGRIQPKGKDSKLYGIRGENHYNYGRIGILNKNYGRKFTYERKINLSKSIKKSYENFNNKKSIILLSQNTGVFYSVNEASFVYNIKYSYIASMVNNTRNNKTDLIKC